MQEVLALNQCSTLAAWLKWLALTSTVPCVAKKMEILPKVTLDPYHKSRKTTKKMLRQNMLRV
jgi:hypothetical protein